MLFSSINHFSPHQFRSSPSISSALLIDGFGRVRQKVMRKNFERIKRRKICEKTENGYVFKSVGTP